MILTLPPPSFGLRAPLKVALPLTFSFAWQAASRLPEVWPNAEAQPWLPWVASVMEAASSRWSEGRLWVVQQVWQLQQELTVP